MKRESKTIIERPKRGWSVERRPTHPGLVLQEEFLTPLSMTQRELAEELGYEVKAINRLCNGKSSVSTRLAIKLAERFGTSPEFWLNLQQAIDVWDELHSPKSQVG